jgi:hypothetical protein
MQVQKIATRALGLIGITADFIAAISCWQWSRVYTHEMLDIALVRAVAKIYIFEIAAICACSIICLALYFVLNKRAIHDPSTSSGESDRNRWLLWILGVASILSALAATVIGGLWFWYADNDALITVSGEAFMRNKMPLIQAFTLGSGVCAAILFIVV